MEANPIRLTVTWRIPPREASSISRALHPVMVETRRDPACRGCSSSTELGVHAVIRYVEEWDSEPDLQRRIQSTRFGALSELMKRASVPAGLEIEVQGRTRGMEYVVEVRRSPGVM
jgi:quinol monooxygenase YgiN